MTPQTSTSSPSRSIASPFGDIDILDPKTHTDAWPLYTWLREKAPVYWEPNNEIWVVSGYDEIIEVARQPKIYCSSEGNVPKLPPDPSFINLDGRDHIQRRKLIHGYFTPKAIRKMTESIRAAVDTLIDNVIETGRCNFVQDIARPLPMNIIGHMLGIPEEHHADVADWMDVFMTGGNGPLHVTDEVNEAFINFGALHFQLADERRENPQDDLLSLWLQAEIDGVPLDDDQLLFEHTMMIIGGGETARAALAGGVKLLAEHPDQRAWLAENIETGMKGAAEEAVRYVCPFVRMSRTATQDADLFGNPIRKGEEVLMLYPPANRDPNKFENPDTFDIRRPWPHKSLAFGHGHHFCLGAFLARAEIGIAIEQMLKRMPDWRVVGEPVLTESSFLRGLKSLELEFTPGSKVN